MCLGLGSPLCSDLGTASNFLKNYFNKVRHSQGWGRRGSTRLRKEEKPRSLSRVPTPAREGLRPPRPPSPPRWSPGTLWGRKAEVRGPRPGLTLHLPGLRASATLGLRGRLQLSGSPGRAPGRRGPGAARGSWLGAPRRAVRVRWEPPAAQRLRFYFLPPLSRVYNFTNE